jgi:hypothetical protein
MPDMLPLHPPNTYVLELSLASTKCTHGVAIKLFCKLLRFSSEMIPDECDS